MVRVLARVRRACFAALAHDVFGSAKAAAYSAIFCLFPTFLVVTTLLALTPESNTLIGELRSAFSELLPADTMDLLQTFFTNQHARSTHVVEASIVISFFAALGFLLSLMEGFRRAYGLPRSDWSFWKVRIVAVLLIPSCLVPMCFATVLVAFGHQIELWVVSNADHIIRGYVLFLWRMIRWAIGLLTTISVLAVVYHFGTPRRRAWRHVIPGAAGAAVLWFLATLLYGFYITRFADYSIVYGSLGTVVATMVWLYITSLSVLAGAELNANLFPRALPERTAVPVPVPAEKRREAVTVPRKSRSM